MVDKTVNWGKKVDEINQKHNFWPFFVFFGPFFCVFLAFFALFLNVLILFFSLSAMSYADGPGH